MALNACKKHLSMYGTVFCFTICLTLNGLLGLQQRPGVIAFGISSFLKWLACIVKKKEKDFDVLGTSLESEQDQEISSSIKSFL